MAEPVLLGLELISDVVLRHPGDRVSIVQHLRAAPAAEIALFCIEGFDLHRLRGLAVRAAPPQGLGLGLAATWAAWKLIMAALYPACR